MSGFVFLLLRLLLTAAVFGFMGWALFILWRDLRKQSEQLPTSQFTQLTLSCSTKDGVRVFRFGAGDVLVGRDPACDCHLDDRTISSRHARMSYQNNRWWVEDLGSRNGTFLNQQPVREPLVMESGDQLRCGGVYLEMIIDSEERVYN